MTRELKGRHVLVIAVTAFAIVIGANLAMLFAATGSFPGLVVKNSYVASQKWNARTAAQQALGWRADVTYAGGEIAVVLTASDGAPVEGAELTLLVGRPSNDAEDRALVVDRSGNTYRAAATLGPGRWRIEVATAGGPEFRKTAQILVPETE